LAPSARIARFSGRVAREPPLWVHDIQDAHMPNPDVSREMSAPETDLQSKVLAFLADGLTQGGNVAVKRVDTHGAIVFLAGDDVYKVKRAVRFPFMDFSTLEKRKAACDAELEINRASAPQIYLGVTPITRRDEGFALGGEGDIVEWAVHMKRFDEDATFDHLASRDVITPEAVADLATSIVAAHSRAPPRPDFDFAASLARYINQNDAAFGDAAAFFEVEVRHRITTSSRAALSALGRLLCDRQSKNFVRRCHGDLHLGNIALIDGKPVLFDAIEFDDAIATCDVLYDVAFTLMDFEERDLRWAANLLLNRYLWRANDESHYRALSALPLFLSIRAAIRAKVMYAGVERQPVEARAGALATARRYFDLASTSLTSGDSRLIAVGGLSGSGKSRLCGELAPLIGAAPGAIWLRSDIERKSMFGVAETTRLPPSAYTSGVTKAVYERLRARASLALGAGRTVLVDAVHARPEERNAIAQVARDHGVAFTEIWLDVPDALREHRVSGRSGDASDADASIARTQSTYEPGIMNWNRVDASDEISKTLNATLEIVR
jgi:aminoglycoside phosphotransferase family enzyme/predicted kinase